MNQSTILLLADALSFQMAAFFYTAATQTEKSRLTTCLLKRRRRWWCRQQQQQRWWWLEAGEGFGWGGGHDRCGKMMPPIHS
jgi:hypothetical protein